MFDIISCNYHPEAKAAATKPLISAKINTLIDKSRYPVSGVSTMSFNRKRIALVSIIVILLREPLTMAYLRPGILVTV